VSSDIAEYRSCWLYCLAMIWGVEILELQLGDRAAEASFALAGVISGESGDVAHQGMEEDEGEEPEVLLDWEEAEEDLHGDLARVVERVRQGRSIDVRALLEGIPRYHQLSNKAPENNHRRDGQNRNDKQLRSLQNSLLHTQRIFAAVGKHDQGGRDHEGEAQTGGEIPLFVAGFVFVFLLPGRFLLLFVAEAG